MKALVLLSLYLSLSQAATLKYCGKPIANISNEDNIHLLVTNEQNKPKEIVVADAIISKTIVDKMDEIDSEYICLTGTLALEETVYLLKYITESEFF